MIDSKAMYENLENHLASAADEERSLMGAIIKQPSCILHAMELIDGSDFHDLDMGKVFNYLAVMFQAGEPVDDVSFLVPNLRNAGLLSIVGGVAGIAKLIDEGMPHHVRSYATQLSKWSRLRRLRNVAASILSLTDTRNPDPDEIAEKASNSLTLASATRSSDVLTAGQLVDAELLEIEKAFRSKKLIGISTGMNSVDKETGGIFAELTILAARPSVGKTAFAMELARASFKEKRILFCSLEMSKTQLSHRLLSRETGIPVRAIRNNELSQKDMELIRKATPEIRKMEAMYWCKPDVTVAQIHAKARAHAAKHGLDMLIIDYLGLIKSPGKDLYEKTSRVSNDLAILAKSLNKPVICLCQLNRSAEDKIPELNNLRDSGSIEQDADCVWLLHRHRDKDETNAVLRIAKARQSQCGDIPLSFDPNRCAFTDVVPINEEVPEWPN